MPDRRINGFFYGLFMDSEILRKCGVLPVDLRHAFVDGYALRIGKRATLVPNPDESVYGMIFALTHHEFEKLYTRPGLEQYRPEAIMARTLDGQTVAAICYNLPEAPGPDESNAEYAADLRIVLGKLGFPPDYIASVS